MNQKRVSDAGLIASGEPGPEYDYSRHCLSDGGKVIFFDYQPRPWQNLALAALEERRLAVIVAHRRAGKTELMVIRLLLAAMTCGREHPAPFFAYVAPFLNQAKAVAWDRLKFYARHLPGLKINESELAVTLWNKAAVRLFGADYPDRLRGLGFDGVVMDEVAQMRPETWPAVVRPALADRGGWAAFIGTPKGINAFHDIYQTALRLPDQWYSAVFTASDTGVIDADELEKLRQEMGDGLFNREFLCDFSADSDSAFIDFQTVLDAARRPGPLINRAPLVLGLDVARYGDDRTVLIFRRGAVLEDLYVWRGRDLMWTASELAQAINRFQPKMVFIDSVGLGAGVVDRLKQLGHRVVGVNSGGRPARGDQYSNLKAEMWAQMRQWLVEDGVIPDRVDLRNDLLAPGYDFDSAGRLKIESKEELKKRGLPSTDLADALALTFAQPVAAVDKRQGRPAKAEMD